MLEIPRSGLVGSAHEFVGSLLAEPILNHSVRVAHLSVLIAESEGIQVDEELLWIASLFHDFGTVAGAEAPERFEVVGGDAAIAFLREHSRRDEADLQSVWDAIALHTSPHIAECRGGLTRVIRLGVLMDFGEDVLADSSAVRARIENDLPRRDVEVVLASAVVAQAIDKPEKAPPSSWPHGLYAAYLAATGSVTITRLSEKIEVDDEAMVFIAGADLIPGKVATVVSSGSNGVVLENGRGRHHVPPPIAELMFALPGSG